MPILGPVSMGKRDRGALRLAWSALALMLGIVLLIFRWPQLKLLRRQVRHA